MQTVASSVVACYLTHSSPTFALPLIKPYFTNISFRNAEWKQQSLVNPPCMAPPVINYTIFTACVTSKCMQRAEVIKYLLNRWTCRHKALIQLWLHKQCRLCLFQNPVQWIQITFTWHHFNYTFLQYHTIHLHRAHYLISHALTAQRNVFI